mmetsp:Transcript_4012/g.14173  ORF Transcript_4012/g.14173 Transcript_4012/m.14173 type:complete len:262 (-) Transcript_4012:68-853(-)|eukprot:CAMPEP_0114616702 /NCGR_PEP_ID=MMETSP0168-20121206/6821_1 /TAXON_ID=95228 ORGANISM="Vannella sp., Strain DIVA3 517/6/12" /NCGR_SAMPLE_ID=MMETSP0168 /ASSEMBLY_ACC=CAM_ASM_000044 /LENGTH=261 /DNA_ID=CAMNT_0001827821 /DNA_START=239 /DNA_END=1024 /DNA_ORIENTATION=-
MDVLCSLVQQDIAEVEKEDREMAARARSSPSPNLNAYHGGYQETQRPFSPMDTSDCEQSQQLPSLSGMIDQKNSSSSAAEMAYAASPSQALRGHPVYHPQAQRPQGMQLSRQQSAQRSWQASEATLLRHQPQVRRTSSAPNSGGPRQPLYPSVPSLMTEKRAELPSEKIARGTKRSIRKTSSGPQKAKKRRSSLQLPGDVYCRLCGTKETPEWRRGPDGLKSLCNACGIHFARMMRAERKVVAAKEEETRKKASIINIMNH